MRWNTRCLVWGKAISYSYAPGCPAKAALDVPPSGHTPSSPQTSSDMLAVQSGPWLAAPCFAGVVRKAIALLDVDIGDTHGSASVTRRSCDSCSLKAF